MASVAGTTEFQRKAAQAQSFFNHGLSRRNPMKAEWTHSSAVGAESL
jgi:hypothetical protein